ncbi:MAG: hypothetical protein ORN26_02465 [Candidatus Pacebacteria bacterium]|nr:hypothetical protein [Candidatus Paceibacterota bacterium]
MIPSAIQSILEYISISSTAISYNTIEAIVQPILQIIFSSIITLYLVNIYKRFKAHHIEANHTIDNKTIKNIIIGFSIFGVVVVVVAIVSAVEIAQYFLN